jgi:DNA repair protein RadA/Sms
VGQAGQRIKEAKMLGFTRCILPKASLKTVQVDKSLDIVGVTTLQEALDALF